MNIFSSLSDAARRYPQNGAVYLGDTIRFTYQEVLDRTLRLARFISANGEMGDRVAILAKNCPEYIELLFAIWAAGRVAVPLNAKLHPLETRHILADCGAGLIFMSPELLGDFRETGEQSVNEIVRIGDQDYLNILRADAADPQDRSAADLAWLFYTSGTTGRPKGAMLTHRNLMAMQMACLADFGSIEADHSLIHAAPMSHGSGLYAIPYIARGARHVIPSAPNFDPSEILALCDSHPNCDLFLPPTMVRRLRESAEVSGHRPSQLHKIIYGGGPMYVEELKQSLAVFGPVFAQLYGQGEAPMTITGLRNVDHRERDDRILGSVGWPRSGVEVQIVDSNGARLSHGQVGEIVCRGDVVMAGYWNNAEATDAALRNGWLWTGDMGSMGADGLLTLRDRSKDVIISGGSNIYPREVEEVLLKHSSVLEVSVVGQEDAEWGEIVVAFVVPDKTRPVNAEEMSSHCIRHIARFKKPKRYIFIEALPKNAYGKVLKRELIKQLSGNK